VRACVRAHHTHLDSWDSATGASRLLFVVICALKLKRAFVGQATPDERPLA